MGCAELDSTVRAPASRRLVGFLSALVTGWRYFWMVAMLLFTYQYLMSTYGGFGEVVRWRHASLVSYELAELKANS